MMCLVLSPVLVTAGCFLTSGTQQPVSTDYLAQIKKAGVVSLLPARPNVSFLGTSAMESRFSTAIIRGWSSDKPVYRNLVERLKRKGFSVRPLQRTAVLTDVRNSDWSAPAANSVAEEIYALGEEEGLDMIVVVRSHVEKDIVTDTNQSIRGFGVQRAFDTEAFAYATVHIETFDIKRRISVGRADAVQYENAVDGLWSHAFAGDAKEHELKAARSTAFKEQVERVLTQAVGIAAQEAGL